MDPTMPPLVCVASVLRSPRVVPFDLALQVPRRRWLTALRGGERPIVLRFHGDDTSQGVRIDVLSHGPLEAREIEGAIADAVIISGLDDDPVGLSEVAERHPLVRKLHRRFAGARLGQFPTVWQAFATAVVEQLVTSYEARVGLGRMRARHGAEVAPELRAFPTAEAIARVPPFELRAMGIGLRRATTLIMGARLGDRLERLRSMPVLEAMGWLQSLRGVGPWTANKVAIGALGHADGVLVGDAGMPFVATMALTGRAGGDDEMLACLAPFSPHRARVCRLFELSRGQLGGVPGVPPQRPPVIDPHRRFPWRR